MGEITSSSVRSYDASCQLTMVGMAIDDGQNPTVVKIHLKRTKLLRSQGLMYFWEEQMMTSAQSLPCWHIWLLGESHRDPCSDFRMVVFLLSSCSSRE